MTCVIKAEDFNPSMADPLRGRWAGAEVGTIVEALNGRRVAITVDNRTGHTLTDARLIDVRHMGYGHGSPHVLIKAPDMEGGLWHDLFICGMILPLEAEADRLLGGDATKWRALEIFRKQQRVAIRTAQQHEQGEAAGRQCGSWKARPSSATGLYYVSYEPSVNPPKGTPAGARLGMEIAVSGDTAQARRVTDFGRRAF
jgi:hypothetical protein